MIDPGHIIVEKSELESYFPHYQRPDDAHALLVGYLRTLADKGEVEFNTEIHDEYDSPEGHFAYGDPELDRQAVADIREQLTIGNEWAWCSVKVTATFGDWTGWDSLGAVSCASERDFNEAFLADMQDEALRDLAQRILDEAAPPTPEPDKRAQAVVKAALNARVR